MKSRRYKHIVSAVGHIWVLALALDRIRLLNMWTGVATRTMWGKFVHFATHGLARALTADVHLAGSSRSSRAPQTRARPETTVTKNELILAALAPANGKPFTPVQVQKLFFILDRKVPEAIGGPHFDFTPYHYGPFDAGVYRSLEAMAQEELVAITQRSGFSMQTFRLTPDGQKRGELALSSMDPRTREYVSRLSEFVRTSSFENLVAAVYREFPEMKVNSIFRDKA
jgi:hypothetical protein